MKKDYKILITGVAGFIGYHLANKFNTVKNTKLIGIDNLNNYYDKKLKLKRLNKLKGQNKFKF